jgi:hypothetical protein
MAWTLNNGLWFTFFAVEILLDDHTVQWRPKQRPNSWTYKFVEVSGLNIESSQVFMYNVYLHYNPVSNHFCSRRGEPVSRGDCEYQGVKLWRLLPRLTSKNSASENSITCTPGTYPLIYLSTLVIKTIFRAQNPPLSLSPLTNKEPKITLHSIKIKSKSKVKCLMARSLKGQ